MVNLERGEGTRGLVGSQGRWNQGQGGILWQIPLQFSGFSSIIIGFMVNLERGEGTRGLVGRRRNEWQPGPLEPGGRGAYFSRYVFPNLI